MECYHLWFHDRWMPSTTKRTKICTRVGRGLWYPTGSLRGCWCAAGTGDERGPTATNGTIARHTRTFTMRKLIPCTFVDGFHFVVMIMTNIHHPSSLPTQIKDMFCHMSYHRIIRRTPLRILDYSCCVCLYLLSLSLIHRCRRSTHATWIVFHTLKSSMALGLI